MQNLARFRMTSKFGGEYRIVIPSIAIPPALGETSPVKFGPVTLDI